MFGTSSTRYLIGSRRAKAKGGGNPMGGPRHHVAQFAYALFRHPVFRGSDVQRRDYLTRCHENRCGDRRRSGPGWRKSCRAAHPDRHHRRRELAERFDKAAGGNG